MKADCSERLSTLAQPKKLVSGYLSAYVLPREVPESALRAHLTPHIEILAKPRYNKDTYARALWNNKQN